MVNIAVRHPRQPPGRKAGPSDHELVERLRRGEPRALTETYRIHQAALRAFARRRLGDEGTADDLVQDIFLALPNALLAYREEASLRTFLTAIVAHRIRRHRRSAARRRAALTRLARQPAASPARPDDLAGRRELGAALRRGLDTLPPAQRDAFLLFSVEQLSSREAAAVVGSPEETLRTRHFHARRKLRAFLEQEGLAAGGPG